MKKILTIVFLSAVLFNGIKAQGLLTQKENVFTRQDTLRGSITKERAWWDAKNYHLDIKVNPLDSTITGSNTIRYKVLLEYNVMQIDLQMPLEINKVIQDGKELKFKREGNAFFIEFFIKNSIKSMKSRHSISILNINW